MRPAGAGHRKTAANAATATPPPSPAGQGTALVEQIRSGPAGMAYNIVAAGLGHKNETVTRSVHMAPLQQDRLWASAAFANEDAGADSDPGHWRWPRHAPAGNQQPW